MFLGLEYPLFFIPMVSGRIALGFEAKNAHLFDLKDSLAQKAMDLLWLEMNQWHVI